jgi:hypothetical protein
LTVCGTMRAPRAHEGAIRAEHLDPVLVRHKQSAAPCGMWRNSPRPTPPRPQLRSLRPLSSTTSTHSEINVRNTSPHLLHHVFQQRKKTVSMSPSSAKG